MRRWLAVMVVAWWGIAGVVQAEGEKVCVIRVEGAIGPSAVNYIDRAIHLSADDHAQCLVIELDTPGGLLASTKIIVQRFLSSPVPVVVYVAPAGATATSAGCFITLAADVAAMAPTTTIGAAHPVVMGPGGSEGGDDTMKKKMENYATSYIEMIAQKRKRNVEWAKKSVMDSASISAAEALKEGVVEIVAEDMTDLLKQLNGREVNGKTLATAAAATEEIPQNLRERVFAILFSPEMMMILGLLVIYGLIGELSNPGAILPGVVGVIALILLLYVGSVLPINIAGVVLLALAVGLFVADAFLPSHGVLTVGGVVAFFLGMVMLFDRAEPIYRLSLTWIIPATVVTALFFSFVVGAGLRAQWRPVQVGTETMRGKVVTALTRIDAANGKVFIEGEYWNAVSEIPVEEGQEVEVVAVEGLLLKVKPKTRKDG
jgi:membrane-bound serine protease (ClpP class)